MAVDCARFPVLPFLLEKFRGYVFWVVMLPPDTPEQIHADDNGDEEENKRDGYL